MQETESVCDSVVDKFNWDQYFLRLFERKSTIIVIDDHICMGPKHLYQIPFRELNTYEKAHKCFNHLSGKTWFDKDHLTEFLKHTENIIKNGYYR